MLDTPPLPACLLCWLCWLCPCNPNTPPPPVCCAVLARYAHDRAGHTTPWDVICADLLAMQPYQVLSLRTFLAVPYFEKVGPYQVLSLRGMLTVPYFAKRWVRTRSSA